MDNARKQAAVELLNNQYAELVEIKNRYEFLNGLKKIEVESTGGYVTRSTDQKIGECAAFFNKKKAVHEATVAEFHKEFGK